MRSMEFESMHCFFSGGDVLLDSAADRRFVGRPVDEWRLRHFCWPRYSSERNLQSLTSIALNAGRDYLMINGTSTLANQAIVAIAGDQIDLAFHQRCKWL